MSKCNVFEQYRHIPGENMSLSFTVKRNGKTQTARYYFYLVNSKIEVTQICFIDKNGNAEVKKFQPKIIVDNTYSLFTYFKPHITTIKIIKKMIKNGEL